MTSANRPIVMKFGGAALADGARVQRAARLVAARRVDRPIVVVSAVQGATDLLDQAAKLAASGTVDAKPVRLRHRSLLAQLGLDAELVNRLLVELGLVLDAVRTKGRLEPRERDVILSFGERMSARIFAQVLRSQGIDATPIDAFDLGLRSDSNHGRARPLSDATGSIARNLSTLGGIPVVTGFLAADEHGNLTTLGRNGSDLTAALIGEAAGAREVQFWKTVGGVMTADPKLVPNARTVERLNYREAALLAFCGAKVLFAEALEPLERARLAARVLCCDDDDEFGTRVDDGAALERAVAIAVRRDVARIELDLGSIEERAERRTKILSELASRAIELVAFEEEPRALGFFTTPTAELASALRAIGGANTIDRELSLLTIVGVDAQIAPRALAKLELSDVHVRHAALRRDHATFAVADAELEFAARVLHAELFERELAPIDER